MKKFFAKSIDEAIEKAKQEFNCSLTQIEYEIIQNPSTGLFGFGKKEAIIIAMKKKEIDTNQTQTSSETNNLQQESMAQQQKETGLNTQIHIQQNKQGDTTVSTTTTTISQEKILTQDSIHTDISIQRANNSNSKESLSNVEQEIPASTLDINESHENTTQVSIDTSVTQKTDQDNLQKNAISEKIISEFDNQFYDETAHIPWQDSNDSIPQNNTQDIENICKEVQDDLGTLLKFLQLDLTKVQVTPYDSHTLSILIDGLDAALLIGQKGYRYKSLSYLLFNWIHTCYGYGVRLEIAQFLKNQEEMIRSYLTPIIESAKLNGKAQTKPLDGVLTHIALKILRDELPNKYIVFRDTAEGQKYITISDFITNNNYRNNGFGSMPKY